MNTIWQYSFSIAVSIIQKNKFINFFISQNLETYRTPLVVITISQYLIFYILFIYSIGVSFTFFKCYLTYMEYGHFSSCEYLLNKHKWNFLYIYVIILSIFFIFYSIYIYIKIPNSECCLLPSMINYNVKCYIIRWYIWGRNLFLK